MKDALKVTRMQLGDWGQTLIVPIAILVGTTAFLWVFFGLLAAYVPGEQGAMGRRPVDMGSVYQTVLFLSFSISVWVFSSYYPITRALGGSRRGYFIGTSLYYAGLAAIITAIVSVLYLTELASGHWFVGQRILDAPLLGDGGLRTLWLITFPASFFAMTLAALFAASWMRFAALGPWVTGAAVVVVVASLVLLGSANRDLLLTWLSPVTVAISFLTLSAAFLGGASLLLRRASIRG